MTSSLSKNLVCQLQAKGKWLIILESLKGNQTWPTASTTNQTNKVLLRAKMIHICGVHMELLPQTSPGDILPPFDFYLYLYLYLNFFYSGWLAPISQPFSIMGGLCLNTSVNIQFQEGYVLKFCILLFLSCLGDLCLHIQFSIDLCTSVVIILNRKLTRGASQHAWVLLDDSDSRGSFYW